MWDIFLALAGPHPIILAALLVVVGLIYVWQSKRWSLRQRCALIVLLVICSAVSAYFVHVSARSLPVLVDISVEKGVLTLRSEGPGSLNNMNIFATEYKVAREIREGGHLYFNGEIDTVSGSFPVEQRKSLEEGETITLDLSKTLTLSSGLPVDYEALRTFYILRLSVVPIVTHVEEACHIAISSVKDMPSFFNEPGTASMGGSYAGIKKVWFKLQKEMIESQEQMFRDIPGTARWCKHQMMLGHN